MRLILFFIFFLLLLFAVPPNEGALAALLLLLVLGWIVAVLCNADDDVDAMCNWVLVSFAVVIFFGVIYAAS